MDGGFRYAPAALTEERRDYYRTSGFQADVTPAALMARNRSEFGALTAVLDDEVALTWRELLDAAGRFGAFLQAKGIGPGHVVMWQLPNWWEALVVAHGIWAAGAISSPVVPIYREFELRQVVEAVRPSCVVTAESFRGVEHVALVEDACRTVGWDPPVRVVLRGAAPGWTPLDDALAGAPAFLEGIDPDSAGPHRLDVGHDLRRQGRGAQLPLLHLVAAALGAVVLVRLGRPLLHAGARRPRHRPAVGGRHPAVHGVLGDAARPLGRRPRHRRHA